MTTMRSFAITIVGIIVSVTAITPAFAKGAKKDKNKVSVIWMAPTANSIVTAPANLTLSADAFAKQLNHPIVEVEFFNGTTLIGRKTAPISGLNYQLNWQNVPPGTYQLSAAATNSKGDYDETGSVAITVVKGSQMISGFNPASPLTFTLAPQNTFSLAATGGASNNAVTFASSSPSVCAVTGSIATILSAGTCTLTADQAGDTNYNSAPQVTATVIINKANQSIAGFTPTSQVTYASGATFALTGSGGASGNPVIFASTTPTVCSVTTNIATVLSAGTCTITSDQAGDTNYNTAPQVTASITINKANQTITGLGPTFPITYAANPPGNTITLTAIASSGLPVTFASNSPSVCTTSGTHGATLTIVSAGTCTWTADQTGDSNIQAAPQVTASITINKATQTITGFTPPDTLSQAQGTTIPLTATGGPSGNPVTFVSATPTTCTTAGSSGANLTIQATGSCSVTANQPGNDNYDAASAVTVTISININLEAQLYFIHADHLGTPRAITKASDNTKVWEWGNEDPFGNNDANENPSGQGTFEYNLRFPGQYRDKETATNYNYFRDYDPATGRYVQSDPIGLRGGLSTYVYVDGAPTGRRDRLGLWSTSVHHFMIGDYFRGLDPILMRSIKNGSGDVDSVFNQFGDTNFMHSMRRPNESVEDAKRRTCEFIKGRMKLYSMYLDIPSMQSMAYFYLGQALHPIMDSTSPVHRGWQIWDPAHDWVIHGEGHGSQEGLSSLKPEHILETRNLIAKAMNGDVCACTR